MYKFRSIFILPLILCAVMLTAAAPPPSPEGDDLIVNGGFETGTLEGWTQLSLTFNGFWDYYSGTPQVGPDDFLLPPPEGTYAAASGQLALDTNILFQDVDVPPGSKVSCSLIVYYFNFIDFDVIGGGVEGFSSDGVGTREIIEPIGLFNGEGLIPELPNQQYRVDLMDPDADPFDTGDGVLENLFQTQTFGPNTQDYTLIEFDLTPYAGQTVRLRAATVATQNPLYGGLDAVECTLESVTRPIPTMSEWGLIALAGLIGIAGIIFYRRRAIRA